MGWLDLLAVQGTLTSLLQHHSSKASIFQHSAFFTVQLSHPYMTNGKTMALTRQTFIGKLMSLLFTMLSRLVKTFLLRSKCLLISWFAITICSDFGAQKNKVWHCFHCFPIYLPWRDGNRCHDLSFLNVEFKSTFSLYFLLQGMSQLRDQTWVSHIEDRCFTIWATGESWRGDRGLELWRRRKGQTIFFLYFP